MRLGEWSRRIAAAVVALAPVLACADGTLSFVSDPGEFVGGGTTYSVSFADADISIGGDANALGVYYQSGTDTWSLALNAPQSHALTPACYERAERAPAEDATRPGVEFDFGSRSCGQIAGRYRLIELETDSASGAISKLAVDFVQQCGGPALFGKLRYNSTVSLDTPALDPVFEVGGALHFVSDPGDDVGLGQTRAFDLDRSNFSMSMNPDAGVSGGYQSSTEFWYFDFAAPDGAPLEVGLYEDAVRFPFQGPGQPGLDFVLDGRGCNELSGSFDVAKLDFDRIDGTPTRFENHFVQHCDNAAPALTAEVAVTQVYTNGPLVDDTLFIDGLDGETPWPLVWNCD